MSSISYEYKNQHTTLEKPHQSNQSPVNSFTPRRAIKITSLLNDNDNSPNVFPLFSSFQSSERSATPNGGFQSTTEAMNHTMVLNRPITPFDTSRSPSRSLSNTPLSQLQRPFTPIPRTSYSPFVESNTPQSSTFSVPTTPATPECTPASLSSPKPSTPKAFKTSPKNNHEPVSFEDQLGVLDFRPMKLRLMEGKVAEGKLLDFNTTTIESSIKSKAKDALTSSAESTPENSPTTSTFNFNNTTIITSDEEATENSTGMNFFTSRFISNPNLFKNRKFQCKICDKRFKTTGHLTRHKKIHSGEKKFSCYYPGCESRFSRKDNCMQHYRTHINGKATSTKPKVRTGKDANKIAKPVEVFAQSKKHSLIG